MILQTDDFGRFWAIYVTQLSISFFFLIIAYKILKRNRSQLNLTLSGFYILEAIAFIINAIIILLRVELIVYILYVILLFLVFFGHFFLVMFNLTLLDMKYTLRKNLLYILIPYVILTISIIVLPNGFTFNEQTNWRPVWSWSFLLILYIFTFSVLIIPTAILFIKLYKMFDDRKLKNKMRNFFIGISGMWTALLCGMLWNTWDNDVFKLIWGSIGAFITIPASLLIYYAMGRGL